MKHEWRWGLHDNKPKYDEPEWLGDHDLAGKTLLIYGEQGLGDTIHFIRYAPLAAKQGARVIAFVQGALRELLGRSMLDVEFFASRKALPPFDYQCAMMSLPLAFKTTLTTIPAFNPYIAPAAGRCGAVERKVRDRSRDCGLGSFGRAIPSTIMISHRSDRPRAVRAIVGERRGTRQFATRLPSWRSGIGSMLTACGISKPSCGIFPTPPRS